MLGDKPHQSLTNLSKTYGPVMSLKLGSISTIVISSPETAKEVLHRNDQAFSGREVLIPCFTIYYISIIIFLQGPTPSLPTRYCHL
ncbi:unnamed protein product, partial [Vitis vinifera]|uniref:Uncharacterized protein n=1 Tax=Vitis vinifera TaxID=29760 RepID=D7U7M1_VITVI